MTPLPGPLGGAMVAWRLDAEARAGTWNSGRGAELVGGRWNPKGCPAVYASFDPSTTILEAAVHRGFAVLDTQPFILTSFEITGAEGVHVVHPDDVPNPAWLHAGIPSAGQQAWGADLLRQHAFVVLPSVVSKFSWNVVFDPTRAAGQLALLAQSRLVLDTRLNAAAS